MATKALSKTYADYLAQGNKFNQAYLAPKGAVPRYTKGDNPKFRFDEKMDRKIVEDSNGQLITLKKLYTPNNGYLVRKER